MTIDPAEVARAHWLFGALFLAIVLEEFAPLVAARSPAEPRRSLAIPAVLVLAGVSMWGAAVFGADTLDALAHSLWGDTLIAAGVVEFARRLGRLATPWTAYVLPLTLAVCGVLFMAHVHDSPLEDPVALGHVSMGVLLVLAGMTGAAEARRPSGRRLVAYSAPLLAFATILLAYPAA